MERFEDFKFESGECNIKYTKIILIFTAATSFEQKLSELYLPNEPENATPAQRQVFLHSLIEYNYKLSVHAMGALVKFLEYNWANLNSGKDEALHFMHINQFSL